MNSEDNYRKMKQKYLREQIIGENLDQAKFANFMNEARDDGTNIDNWEFDELISVVEDFKNMMRNQRQQQKEIRNQHQQKMDDANIKRQNFSTIQQESELQQSQENQYKVEDSQEQSQQEIKKKVKQVPQQTGPKRTVVVMGRDPKKRDKFTLQILPEDKKIIRKLNDFYWLQQQLMAEFPYYYIPPIKAVDNKDNFLQNFFTRLMDMKIVNDSEILTQFFDDGIFKSIKKKSLGNINTVIEQKMYKLYFQNDKQEYFQQNEEVYDEFMSEYLQKFQDRKKNPKYFDAIFSNLSNFFNQNTKTFSSLKHLCYDLSEQMQKVGEQIVKITQLYDRFLGEQKNLFSKIGLNQDEGVKKSYESLSTGLQEWGSQFFAQKKFIIDNLASFYHFQKHEYHTFNDLLTAKMNLTQKVNKKLDDLDKRKYKLFQSKDIKKWNIEKEEFNKLDINTVFENFEKVKDVMIPKESEPVLKERELNTFVNKHVLFEYLNFYINSQYYIDENFSSFTEKMQKSFQNKDLLWNQFKSQKEVDVSMCDRESALTLKSNTQQLSLQNFQYKIQWTTICVLILMMKFQMLLVL